jgi:signal transduction histidine kinase
MPAVAPDPGSGMGLKGMGIRARQLGGACVVSQPDEGGTRVCITLPLAGGQGSS